MWSRLNKFPKQVIVLSIDATLVAASFFISYALRFNTLDLDEYLNQILMTLPLILMMRLSFFVAMGLYRGMWRFSGIHDLVSLFKAVTLSSALCVALLFMTSRLLDYPRSVFIIDWFVVFVLVGGIRFVYRLSREGWIKGSAPKGMAKHVLIVGAGRGGRRSSGNC